MSDLFVNTMFINDIKFIPNFLCWTKKRLWEDYVVVVYLNIFDNLLFKYKKLTILQSHGKGEG